MVLFKLDKIIKKKYENHVNITQEQKEKLNYNEFKIKALDIFSSILVFYFSGINQKYIKNILYSEKTNIFISCIDNKFNPKNITSILMCHKTESSNVIKYYILLLGTHERFRKFGYGRVILDEFVDYIKKKYNKTNNKRKIKILLKSLESSVNFYLNYGFVKSNTKLVTNKLFYKYETLSELKLNQDKILEFEISNFK